MSKTKTIEGSPALLEPVEHGVVSDYNAGDIMDAEEDGWPQEPAPAVKAPTTRLLDMLAGWLKYVERDEFPDSESVGDRIADLYQEAGQFASSALTPEEAKALITAFLTDRVAPVLLLTGE